MKAVRVLCVLACAALSTNGAVYAQARGRAPDTRRAAMNSDVQDDLGSGEVRGAPPCPRWSLDDGQPLKWWSSAWTTICIERVRSDAVAMAWAQGQDEHGAPLDADARARKRAELEAWLRRLVGKFRIEGKRWNTLGGSDVRGTAECFGIGNGPGVSCVISAGWKPRKAAAKDERRDKELYSAVRPQILLFGLDPGEMEIRVTHVDSVAVKTRGFLLDDAVILTGQSSPEILVLNSSLSSSQQSLGRASPEISLSRGSPESLDRVIPEPLSRVAINPGGDIDLKFYAYPPDIVTFYNQPIEFSLQLLREPQIDAARPRGAP